MTQNYVSSHVAGEEDSGIVLKNITSHATEMGLYTLDTDYTPFGEMVLSLVNRAQTSVGRHSFRAASIDPDSNWLEETASQYGALLTEFDVPLNSIILDGIEVMDPSRLKTFFDSHLIPPYKGTNFDVVRSDFGEVLSYGLLESQYGTEIPTKSIRMRERADCQARGIDIVGLESDGKLRLVMGECKVSDDPSSPPGVVDDNEDCLRKQLAGHLSRKDETIGKIGWLTRRVQSASCRDRLITAALYWEKERWDLLEIVCCPLLVRSEGAYKSSDFGSLVKDDAGFEKATIRFLILIVPGPIEPTVRKWHSMILPGGS
jgi:hypothetical protein